MNVKFEGKLCEIIFTTQHPHDVEENYALFTGEPITSNYLGSNIDWGRFGAFLNPGTPVVEVYAVLVDVKTNKPIKIIGERKCDDSSHFLDTMVQEHFDNFPEFKNLWQLTKQATNAERKIIQERNLTKVAHFCGLAVDPQFRGYGLADKLVNIAMDNLRNKGYTHVIVECTADGSRRVMEKVNGEVIFAKDYREYETENNLPNNGHQKYTSFIIQL